MKLRSTKECAGTPLELTTAMPGKEFSDLRPDQDMRDTFRQNRALLIERPRKLERMGLATEIETGKWIVSRKAEPERVFR